MTSADEVTENVTQNNTSGKNVQYLPHHVESCQECSVWLERYLEEEEENFN
jgi:hypothetical protein